MFNGLPNQIQNWAYVLALPIAFSTYSGCGGEVEPEVAPSVETAPGDVASQESLSGATPHLLPGPGPMDIPLCAEDITPPTDDLTRENALATYIEDMNPGETLYLPAGEYPSLVLTRPIAIVGLSPEGSCAPLPGMPAPHFRGLTVEVTAGGTQLVGIEVSKGLHVKASAELTRIWAHDHEVCLTLDAEARVDAFLASHGETGVVVQAPATLTNGLIVLNESVGLRAKGPMVGNHLTVAGNGGYGVVFTGGGQTLVNSIIADNFGDWGLFEEVPSRMLEHLLFSRTQFGGAFGGGDEDTRYPKIESEGRRSFKVATLKPGDRRGTEPAMEMRAVIRADIRDTRFFGRDDGPGVGHKKGRALLEHYQPPPSVPFAREDYFDNQWDLLGANRYPQAHIGAIQPAARALYGRTQYYVSIDASAGGDGSRRRPFQDIQEGVDAAANGDVVNVLPGHYQESVYVARKAITLRGVRVKENAVTPINDTNDPLPIIDPSKTGAPEYALFLEDILAGTTVTGMGFENAGTGIAVIGRRDEAPPAPFLSHLRIRGNKKGLDADCAGGELKDSIFEDNLLGASFRSANAWDIADNVFRGKSAGLVFSMVMVHGPNGFAVRGNRFEGAGVYVDSLLGRHGASLSFIGNRFSDASLRLGNASAEARVVLKENVFEDGGVVYPGHSRPECTGCPETPPVLQDPNPCAEGFNRGERKTYPHSSPITVGKRTGSVYAVGSDFKSVLRWDGKRSKYVSVGEDPRSLAVDSTEKLLLVAEFGSGTLGAYALPSGDKAWQIDVGTEPYGVVLDPTGRWAYVTLNGESAVIRVNLKTQSVDGRVETHRKPRGIAYAELKEGPLLAITHFAPGRVAGKGAGTLEEHSAQVTLIDPQEMSVAGVIPLPPIASDHFPDALPTLMQSAVVRGKRLYLPSFGATPERPEHFVSDGRILQGFETTVQALLTVVDLEKREVLPRESVNLNLPGAILNGPYGIAFIPDTDTALIPLYGNNAIARFRVRREEPPVPIRPYRTAVDILVGENPRGVAVSRRGETAYTVNFATGDLSDVDLKTLREIRRTPLGPKESDRLTSQGRHGKRLFYTTQRVATSADFWFTCGTCHPDGRSDGVTWRFDNGPRSTPSLKGALDTLPLHFDADRDELSDFEHTIRSLQGGFSLQRGNIPADLGESMGANPDWEAISAYLREGIDAPRVSSQVGDTAKGREIFTRLRCQQCHGGDWFTDSALSPDRRIEGRQIVDSLHAVGTKQNHDLLGKGGFDSPSLWGVSQTAPYLHDGSARTLEEVLSNEVHLYAGLEEGAEKTPLSAPATMELIRFLNAISEGTPGIESPD